MSRLCTPESVIAAPEGVIGSGVDRDGDTTSPPVLHFSPGRLEGPQGRRRGEDRRPQALRVARPGYRGYNLCMAFLCSIFQ